MPPSPNLTGGDASRLIEHILFWTTPVAALVSMVIALSNSVLMGLGVLVVAYLTHVLLVVSGRQIIVQSYLHATWRHPLLATVSIWALIVGGILLTLGTSPLLAVIGIPASVGLAPLIVNSLSILAGRLVGTDVDDRPDEVRY